MRKVDRRTRTGKVTRGVVEACLGLVSGDVGMVMGATICVCVGDWRRGERREIREGSVNYEVFELGLRSELVDEARVYERARESRRGRV